MALADCVLAGQVAWACSRLLRGQGGASVTVRVEVWKERG